MARHGQFAIIPARALDDTRLDKKDKHIRALLTLGTYADKNGRCFPSLAVIGEQIGASRSAVSAILHDLDSWGYITITPQKRKDDGKTSNLYRIIHDAELPDEFDRFATPVQESSISSEHPVQESYGVSEHPVQNSLVEIVPNVPINVPNECNITPESQATKTAKARLLKAMGEYESKGRRRGVADPVSNADDNLFTIARQIAGVLCQTNPPEEREKFKTALTSSIANECIWQARSVVRDLEAGSYTRQQFDHAIDHFRNGGGQKYKDRTDAKAHWVTSDVSTYISGRARTASAQLVVMME